VAEYTNPRFFKMKRDYGRPFNEDVVNNINSYWRLGVAHMGNDGAVHSTGHLVNGIPAIANDSTFHYKHEDIVWVRWEDRSLRVSKNRR
jgi:hypothetical protein